MRPRFSCLCVIVACAVFTVVVPLHATDAKDEQEDVRLLRRYLTPDGALPTDERDVKALLSRVQSCISSVMYPSRMTPTEIIGNRLNVTLKSWG